MAHITWNYYEIWYCKRKYQILIPNDILQLWIVYYPDADGRWDMDIDFFGNRKGLEALRNACAVLAQKGNIIVYFPCKKNDHVSLDDYFWKGQYSIKREKYVDMVFMKPNSIKINDWKEIRKRILRTKCKQWEYDLQDEFKEECIREKYKFRKEEPRITYRFDTVFFNTLSFEYPALAYSLDCFLVPELEKDFYEDIRDNDQLRGETYLWLYRLRYDAKNWYDFETGIVFWSTDIYYEAHTS